MVAVMEPAHFEQVADFYLSELLAARATPRASPTSC